MFRRTYSTQISLIPFLGWRSEKTLLDRLQKWQKGLFCFLEHEDSDDEETQGDAKVAKQEEAQKAQGPQNPGNTHLPVNQQNGDPRDEIFDEKFRNEVDGAEENQRLTKENLEKVPKYDLNEYNAAQFNNSLSQASQDNEAEKFIQFKPQKLKNAQFENLVQFIKDSRDVELEASWRKEKIDFIQRKIRELDKLSKKQNKDVEK